jgi:hypothetical protein
MSGELGAHDHDHAEHLHGEPHEHRH